jgi:hypothetical protein
MQSASSTAESVSSIPTHFKYLNKYKAGDYKKKHVLSIRYF